MDYYFTICTKPGQKVHGCVHWKEMFISNKNYTVIRCRDRATDKLLGQIVIELTELKNVGLHDLHFLLYFILKIIC